MLVQSVLFLRQVIGAMANLGLKRGDNGLDIYVMCEIPNNVLLIDDFAQHFDGFSLALTT